MEVRCTPEALVSHSPPLLPGVAAMEAQVSPSTYALTRSKPRPWLPPLPEAETAGSAAPLRRAEHVEPSPRAPLAVAAVIVLVGAIIVAFTGPRASAGRAPQAG